jgi:flagellum-specific peptidoglycan hydrolase FlgJ
LLESGYGEGRLAVKGNNHFGIKCHKEWGGKKIYHDDDKKGECFRKYKDPKESYRDHSLFLTMRPRYAFLFDYNIKNYKQWAYGLKKAGYATDKKYPLKLINLIERLNLKRFDRDFKKNIKKESNKRELFFYRVSKGDTLFSISKKFNIEIKTIVKMNHINNNKIYIGQELIIPNN